MSNEKLLSVIIPVYNTAPYLERCIGSIRKQSYHALEIICVDNNSTDNSLEVLKHFAAEDPRVIVMEQPKQGVSAARNLGIQNAHGAYITFVDSDDAVCTEMYQRLIDALEKEGADIAHCGYRRYSPDGSCKDILGTKEYLVEKKWEAVDHLLKGEKYVGSLCNKVYKIELFAGLNGDESIAYNEDLLLNFELFYAADKSVFMDEPFYLYYTRPESATGSSNRLLKRKNSCSVSKKIWDLFKDTQERDVAADRYYYDLVCSYREELFVDGGADKNELKLLQDNIRKLEAERCAISRRNRMDFRFMKSFPAIYKGLYKVYDKVRKPNWDVK